MSIRVPGAASSGLTIPSASDLPMRNPNPPPVALPIISPSLNSALLPSASASSTPDTSSVTSMLFAPRSCQASSASRPRKSPLSGLTKRSMADSYAEYSIDISVPTMR